MEDALAVGVPEGVGHLADEPDGRLDGHRAVDPFLERAARDQRHHDVQVALSLAEVVNQYDVRVQQVRGRARFATESL